MKISLGFHIFPKAGCGVDSITYWVGMCYEENENGPIQFRYSFFYGNFLMIYQSIWANCVLGVPKYFCQYDLLKVTQ